jgi:hypothetical protein
MNATRTLRQRIYKIIISRMQYKSHINVAKNLQKFAAGRFHFMTAAAPAKLRIHEFCRC